MSKAREMADLISTVQELDVDNNSDIFLQMGG
jgi:hypothetical protein